MRNKLLATTAAMLVGMTLASAQNMPNSGAQSERNSAGADRQQQGGDMQRGAQDSRPGAQDKRGQPQRSEERQQRDQTTGQSQPREQGRDQGAHGRSKQEERGSSAQGQNKQSEPRARSETQRDQTTGQAQREQSRKSERGERDPTQGQAPQRQQGQPDQGTQGQAQQPSPKQGQTEQSRSQQNQPQAPQGQAQQQGRADGNVTLTSVQRTRIQQTVLAGNNVPRINNVNFALNVGVAVPTRVRVVDVPPTLIEIYPQWRGHQYFVVQDDIVIVDRTRKIVATLPMASSGRGAAQLDRRGGGDMINLGPDEIRQVQIVLKEKGFYRGEPDGVLGSGTTQALIAFQRQQGLQANGRIDTRTVTALGVSNLSGQQGNQNQPATTGQGGNAQGGNTMQQSPANQNAGAGQQGNPSASQPSTTGQGGGDRPQQPAAKQDSDTSGQSSKQNPSQGNPNSGNK
jgi:peptidoglycan hydrolase-like protein with peptidoglycan-binding domain